MKLTAIAERSGDWWAVEVPEVPGLYTQAKRLEQVEAMVRDAAELLTGESQDSFEVTIEPQVSEGVTEALEHWRRLAESALMLQREAAEDARKAARLMQVNGMTVRDIGQVMGVSYQRVSQILNNDTLAPSSSLGSARTARSGRYVSAKSGTWSKGERSVPAIRAK